MTKRREYLEARNIEIKQLRRDGLTLRAIGEKHGVTREAIRLICKGIPKPDLKTYHKKKCVHCEKEFVVSSDRKTNKTCNKECFAGIQKYNNYKNGKWTNDLIELDCAGCGKKFTKTKKLMSIANHSYVARGKDPSEKEWFCSRSCNLNTIHVKREEKKNGES